MMKTCWIALGMGLVAVLVTAGCGTTAVSSTLTDGAERTLYLELDPLWAESEWPPFITNMDHVNARGQELVFAACAIGGESPYVFEWGEVEGPPCDTRVKVLGINDCCNDLYVKVLEPGSYTISVTLTDAGGISLFTFLTFAVEEGTPDRSSDDDYPGYDASDPGYGPIQGDNTPLQEDTTGPNDSVLGSECFYAGECGEGYVCRDGYCEVYVEEHAQEDSGTTVVDTQTGDVNGN